MTQQREFLVAALAAFAVAAAAAQADIIFDQPPSNYYAAPSDTDYDTFTYGRVWERLADNLSLPTGQSTRHITWWGCYGGGGHPTAPPVGDEYMRIRIYSPRTSDGLPGDVLYEQTTLNVDRTATGRIVAMPGSPPEYRFDLDLTTPFDAVAGAVYWLEIVQLGDVSSTFQWEDATNNPDELAFANSNFPDWQLNPGGSLAFQLSDVPEPRTMVLVGLGFLAAARRPGGSPQ